MRTPEDLAVAFEAVESKLAADDDPAFWREALAVLAEEFVQRFQDELRGASWAMVVGACSHWQRPHQTRWTAAGGFAYPEGYKQWFPKLDWSVTLVYRNGRFEPKAKLPGKGFKLFQAALPSRTRRHNQAAVHARWHTSGKSVLFGFRKLNEKWKCVAASDEKSRGPVVVDEPD